MAKKMTKAQTYKVLVGVIDAYITGSMVNEVLEDNDYMDFPDVDGEDILDSAVEFLETEIGSLARMKARPRKVTPKTPEEVALEKDATDKIIAFIGANEGCRTSEILFGIQLPITQSKVSLICKGLMADNVIKKMIEGKVSTFYLA